MIDIGVGDWIKDYNGYLLMKFTSKYAYSAKAERCSARNGSLPCWLIKLLAFYTSIATWKV